MSSKTPGPPRILIIAPSANMLGGISSLAVRLHGRLSQEPSFRVSFLPIDPPLPLGLKRLQTIKYVRTLLTTAVYLTHLLARVGKYDLVHICSASYNSFLLASTPAILVARLYGRKILLNYHSGNAEGHLRDCSRTVIPLLRLADSLVVSTDFLAHIFYEYGLKASIIPTTLELGEFTYKERAQPAPIFLTSRLLEPIYNVGCVLRAFALIQERFPEARLIVAGDGCQRPELEKLAGELKLKNVEFVGRVPWGQMPSLYSAAHVYLTATDVDNLPSSVLECLASGLPVVTTDPGGIPYFLTHEETCLMVKRDDHAAVASEAIRLIEDRELHLRIARNAHAACDKYKWENVRWMWISLYRGLLNSRPSAAEVGARTPPATGTFRADRFSK